MRLLTCLALCFLPFTAFADWNGTWLGKGSARKPNRPETSCREILLRLEETPRELRVIAGHYICGQIQASFDPARLERRGSELYYRGERIGSLSRDELRIEHVWDDGSTYALSVVKRGIQSAEYKELWTEDGKTAFKVEGVLRRQ